MFSDSKSKRAKQLQAEIAELRRNGNRAGAYTLATLRPLIERENELKRELRALQKELRS